MSSGICGQRRPRSVCASTQSYQGLHCPLKELLQNVWMESKCLILCAHDHMNLHILRMFEDTFFRWRGHFVWDICMVITCSKAKLHMDSNFEKGFLYNTLKLHFYIVKLGCTLFFLFLLKNIDCGYALEPPRRGGSNGYPQSMFFSRYMKSIRIILVYMNRLVFLMSTTIGVFWVHVFLFFLYACFFFFFFFFFVG